MGTVMNAAILTGVRQFEIRQVPDPVISGETDVLVRIKTVGVCGSDIHYYTTGRIGSQVVRYPFIVGHEAAGIVERTGRKVKRLKPGRKVAVEPAVSCGKCDQCRSGREHTCRRLLFLGCPDQMGGCLCEYIVVPERNCFAIGKNMTFEQAAMSEPLAIGVYSAERSGIKPRSNIGILGAGPIGMSVFHAIRAKKSGNVYITDKIDERLARAGKLKPRWSGNPDRSDIVREISTLDSLMLDIVFECSGDPAAIRQAVQLLKPGGKLVIVGITETDEVSFPIHELRRREITIINIRRQVHCTQRALDLITKRKVRVDAMVTHRFRLDETQKAFDLVAGYGDGVMKAMISI
jgi:L-iditol 2-dehydrogenase